MAYLVLFLATSEYPWSGSCGRYSGPPYSPGPTGMQKGYRTSKETTKPTSSPLEKETTEGDGLNRSID